MGMRESEMPQVDIPDEPLGSIRVEDLYQPVKAKVTPSLVQYSNRKTVILPHGADVLIFEHDLTLVKKLGSGYPFLCN